MFLHGDDLEYITETDFQSNRNGASRQLCFGHGAHEFGTIKTISLDQQNDSHALLKSFSL